MQRAGHGGEGHGAHKYRHVLVETVATNTKTKSNTTSEAVVAKKKT